MIKRTFLILPRQSGGYGIAKRESIEMPPKKGIVAKFFLAMVALCSGLICPDTLISGLFTYGGVYDDETQGTQGI